MMDNNILSYGRVCQQLEHQIYLHQQLQNTNRFIYINEQAVNRSQKVLVNPHFKANSKVFVNPNFSAHPKIHINPLMKNEILPGIDSSSTPSTICNAPILSTKIHVNPNVKNIQIAAIPPKVHVNPKFSNVLNIALTGMPLSDAKENIVKNSENKIVLLTKTKLVRKQSEPVNKKRRNSVKSKYKIVKTGLNLKKGVIKINSRITLPNRHLLKLDNRSNKIQKRYNYINKNAITSNLSRSINIKKAQPLKNKTEANVNVILYKRSRNLSFNTIVKTTNNGTHHKLINKTVRKSLIKKVSPETKKIVKKFKIIRKQIKKNKESRVSSRKLKICNIPCPSYRKFGLCRGKELGKCSLKHDPDQIALCTKFLQGACIKENCLLSHNVSPEKMPTCKYYLEGSCLKEACPYLHVKISPKAEVCRDFLEGFCKKAAECEKKHQYLCPDYEKYGKCEKQRCPYPHGKMVRTYLINKNKFVKKCSIEPKKDEQNIPHLIKATELVEKKRYYVKQDSKTDNKVVSNNLKEEEAEESTDKILKNFIGLQSRPQLGSLPTFIPFQNL